MSFLTIDCGTSNCRAAIISGDGRILSQSQEPVTVDCPRPLFAEVGPDRIWQTVCRVVRSEVEKYPQGGCEGIGVSAMLGYVLLGADNEPLMPAMIWMDNRAGAEMARIANRFSQQELYARTGRRPSPELLAPKLLWLARHEPEATSKVSRIIGLKDDIVRRLTGVVQTDVVHLNYTLLFNVPENRLDEGLLSAFDLDAALFPEPHLATDRIGTVTPAAAAETGLTAGTPVISGSSDGTTAMYGAGVLAPDQATLVSGTTDVLMMRSDRWVSDSTQSLTINNAMLPGDFLVGGAMGLSGGAIRWLQSILNRDIKDLERAIGNLPPGAGGLLCVPGLTGERAPAWKQRLSGALIGLRPQHQAQHLYRAALEGTVYRLCLLLRNLRQNGLSPRALSLVGGGANLGVWNQIRADATGLSVARLRVTEATLLGTAMFCRAGLDPTVTLEDVAAQWIEEAEQFSPEPEAHQVYQRLEELFNRYLEQNEALHELLSEAACPDQLDQ